MKKLVLYIPVGIISFFFMASMAFAVSGACSSHGGVDCNAGEDWDGSVICNDGWRDSSVLYDSMAKCNKKNRLDDALLDLEIYNSISKGDCLKWIVDSGSSYNKRLMLCEDEDMKACEDRRRTMPMSGFQKAYMKSLLADSYTSMILGKCEPYYREDEFGRIFVKEGICTEGLSWNASAGLCIPNKKACSDGSKCDCLLDTYWFSSRNACLTKKRYCELYAKGYVWSESKGGCVKKDKKTSASKVSKKEINTEKSSLKIINFKAKLKSNGIKLDWKLQPGVSFNDFNIYIGTSSENLELKKTLHIYNASKTAIVQDLEDEKEYFFAVRASSVGFGGDTEGPLSAIVSGIYKK